MKDKSIKEAMCSIENRVRHVYNQGFEEGRNSYIKQYSDAYDKGLKDAWECAKKILFDENIPRDILKDLGVGSFSGIIYNCSASEVIAKLKEYEKNGQTK